MKKFLIILPLMSLILSGCIVNIKTSGGVDGGVFKTIDNGENWNQITKVYRVDDLDKSFSVIDLTAMVLDPTDNNAVYIGTTASGMYYTYDGGIGWTQTLKGLGRINDIVVSPKERCIIYVAIGNRVYKSSDCNRHWDYQLIETRNQENNQITTMAIDSYNTNIIYAGTSGMGLFRSEDAGFSWQVVKFFNSRIVKVMVNPYNTKIIYVATYNQGIFKTSDAGETWNQLLDLKKDSLKGKQNLLVYRNIILDPTVEDGLLYASQYGLLRSSDGGITWEDLKLLTPKSTTMIYSLAINPEDGQKIYYGIANALYRSVDGGKNWITRSLPTTRAAKFILINPKSPNMLYLGVKKVD